MVSNNVVIFPSVFKTMPFDMPGDFTPIAIVGATPIVIVVNPQGAGEGPQGVRRAAEEQARRATPTARAATARSCTSPASSTSTRSAPRRATSRTRASARCVTDLIGGQIDFGTLALPSVQAHIKSGALRAIGVGGAQRSPAAPEIPTIAEQGLPSYVVEGLVRACSGPKGMAAADVKRVHDAVIAAFADPEVKEAMAKQGNTINVSTSEHAQAYFRSEKDKYAKLVKKAGIELQ